VVSLNLAAEELFNCVAAEAAGQSLSAFLCPADGSAFDSWLRETASGRPIQVKTTTRKGPSRKIILSLTPVRGGNGRVSTVIVARLLERGQPAIHADLFASYTLAKDRTEFLENTLKLLQQVTGCRCIGLRVTTADGDIPYECYTGFSEQFWKKESCLNVDRDHCVCTRVVSGETLESDREATTPAGSFYCHDSASFIAGIPAEGLTQYRGACVQNGFRSIAAIPLRHQGETLGVIHLADERPAVLSVEQLQTTEFLAENVAELLSRFNGYQELRTNCRRLERRISELTQTGFAFSQDFQKERARVAQRLNEHVQQLMVCALFAIESAAQRQAGGKRPSLLGEADRLLREALDESRVLASELCPPVLSELGLGEGVQWLGGQISEQQGVPVEVTAEGKAEPEGMYLRLLLFDVVRQLLESVVGGGAKRVKVRLEPVPAERIRIRVAADGCSVGTDPASTFEAGRRQNIEAGLALIGATMKVTRRKNQLVSVILAPQRVK